MLGGYDLAPVPAALRPGVEALQALLRRTMGRFDALVFCHNDLDPANIIVVFCTGLVALHKSVEDGWPESLQLHVV